MLNVAWKATLGNTTLASGRAGGLLALETSADLSVPLHSCRMVLDGRASVSAVPGDPVKVELGYDTDLSLVFTGVAASIALGIERHRVEALSSFAALTAARCNSLYEKQTAGDIVSDLLRKLGMKKAAVGVGENFASFAVSDREPVWESLRGLAVRCGFDFYADTEDKAVFQRYAVGRTHTFQYGTNILSFEFSSEKPPLDGVEVYGESPAGQGQGDEAGSWLTKKPVKGTAGRSSGNVLRVADPSARTESAARDIAKNLFDAQQVKARGTLKVIGAPKVRLGDAVQISSMGDSSRNGMFKVTGIRHSVSSQTGFTTRIAWEKI